MTRQWAKKNAQLYGIVDTDLSLDQIQRLRDNADCAEQEFDVILEEDNPGLSTKLSFDITGFRFHRARQRRVRTPRWQPFESRGPRADRSLIWTHALARDGNGFTNNGLAPDSEDGS